MAVGTGEILRVHKLVELLVCSGKLKVGAAFATVTHKNSRGHRVVSQAQLIGVPILHERLTDLCLPFQLSANLATLGSHLEHTLAS